MQKLLHLCYSLPIMWYERWSRAPKKDVKEPKKGGGMPLQTSHLARVSVKLFY